jgi:2-polyprenyl-6-methoxyphenol hydroxylase-like FAD-dependent oxidoreductase
MPKQVVIVGSGIAGLAAALLLARTGTDVLLFERDPMPEIANADHAFEAWQRRSVPQWRLGHAFMNRARELLLERAPDVVDSLIADGARELDLLGARVPAESRQIGDEKFTVLASRRPAFELALRRAVESEPRVQLLSPVVVSGLLLEPGSPFRVRGVRLDDGSELRSEFVLDCGGRRSPVSQWLAAAGITVSTQIEDCQLTYFTRYFREQPGSSLPRVTPTAGNLGFLAFAIMIGDNLTFSINLAAPPWDEELKVLRHTWAWDAVARGIPTLAPRIDPTNATPLHDVQVMAQLQNVRRYYLDEGELSVIGLVSLGDALCTSNPQYAWGASMALTHAVAISDALATHADDVAAAALAYYHAVDTETDAVYRSSAASDRIRSYRWKGTAIPESDTKAADEQDLLQCVFDCMREDPAMHRAYIRRMGLLEPPDAIFGNDEIMAKARAARDRNGSRATANVGPTREHVLELLAAAAPR